MRGSPAPSDTAQKWLAFGAVVVVIVGVSFASRAFKSHMKETLPQPEPPSDFSPSAPDPAPAATVDPDDAPPADDEPPKFPSSIEASKNARPAWAALEAYAPQHSTPDTVFALGSTIGGTLWRRLVVCRVMADDSLMGETPGELEMRMSVGTTPEIVARGGTGETVMFASAAAATLERNEKLQLRVSLRRGGKVTELRRFSDDLADEEISFAEDRAVNAECVTLSAKDLDDRVAKDAGRADALIRRRMMPKLDHSKVDWGYPRDDLAKARKATSDVAALVGWDDPRTRRRVSALVGVQASLESASEPIFDHFYRSSTKQALAADLEWTLDSVTCTKKQQCVAKLTVKNASEKVIVLASTREGSPPTWIATKRSGPVFFQIETNEPKTLLPGTSAKLEWELPETLPATGPALLGICSPSRCSALVLR